MTLTNSPSERSGHSIAHDSNSNSVFVQGGSDLWILPIISYHQCGVYNSKLTSLGAIYEIKASIDWTPNIQSTCTSIEVQVGISNSTN